MHVVCCNLYPHLPSNEASFSRRQIHHHCPRISSWSRVDTEWTPATDLIRNTTQAFIIVKALVALKVLSPHRKNEQHKIIFYNIIGFLSAFFVRLKERESILIPGELCVLNKQIYESLIQTQFCYKTGPRIMNPSCANTGVWIENWKGSQNQYLFSRSCEMINFAL